MHAPSLRVSPAPQLVAQGLSRGAPPTSSSDNRCRPRAAPPAERPDPRRKSRRQVRSCWSGRDEPANGRTGTAPGASGLRGRGAGDRQTRHPIPSQDGRSFQLDEATGLAGWGRVPRAATARLAASFRAESAASVSGQRTRGGWQRFYQEGAGRRSAITKTSRGSSPLATTANFHYIAFEYINGRTIRRSAWSGWARSRDRGHQLQRSNRSAPLVHTPRSADGCTAISIRRTSSARPQGARNWWPWGWPSALRRGNDAA